MNFEQLSGDSSTKSLMDIAVNSNSLKLKWKDNSGCAPQMTSLNLKVLQVIKISSNLPAQSFFTNFFSLRTDLQATKK